MNAVSDPLLSTGENNTLPVRLITLTAWNEPYKVTFAGGPVMFGWWQWHNGLWPDVYDEQSICITSLKGRYVGREIRQTS